MVSQSLPAGHAWPEGENQLKSLASDPTWSSTCQPSLLVVERDMKVVTSSTHLCQCSGEPPYKNTAVRRGSKIALM